MRYKIGDKVPFLHVKFEYENGGSNADGLAFWRYIPWEHKLLSIDILMLTCTEHERVSVKDQERMEDNFIFQDDSGQRWINDRGDPEYVEREVFCAEEIDAQIAKGVNCFHLKSLSRYLCDVSRGIFDIHKEIASGNVNVDKYQKSEDMLQAHYNEVVTQFESQSGLEVVRRERSFGSGPFRGFYNIDIQTKQAV